MRQPIVDVGIVQTAGCVRLAVEDLLTVIRHIDDDGIAIGIMIRDSLQDRVIIEQRIVVVSQSLQLLSCQFRAIVILGCKLSECLLRITG